jgi:hypothetical protein
MIDLQIIGPLLHFERMDSTKMNFRRKKVARIPVFFPANIPKHYN